MRDVIDSGDRPATELLEIEITPEMIEVGTRTAAKYCESNSLLFWEETAREIYVAMTAARSGSRKSD